MSAPSVLLACAVMVTSWGTLFAAFKLVTKMVNDWPEQVRSIQESTAHTMRAAVESAVKVVVAPYERHDAGGKGPDDAAHMEVMPGWVDADTRIEEDDVDPTDAYVKLPESMRPEVALLGEHGDGPFGVEGLKRDPDRYTSIAGLDDVGWGR